MWRGTCEKITPRVDLLKPNITYNPRVSSRYNQCRQQGYQFFEGDILTHKNLRQVSSKMKQGFANQNCISGNRRH